MCVFPCGHRVDAMSFDEKALVDKLARFSNTQQSIETLAQWCMFHAKRAPKVGSSRSSLRRRPPARPEPGGGVPEDAHTDPRRARPLQVVACWEREFVKADTSRRLAFLSLANHIMQESRKKGPEFVTQFTVRVLCTPRDVCRAQSGRGHSPVRSEAFDLMIGRPLATSVASAHTGERCHPWSGTTRVRGRHAVQRLCAHWRPH